MSKTKICISQNDNGGYDLAHVSIGKKGAIIRTWPEGVMEWEETSVSPGEAEEHIFASDKSLTVDQACNLAGHPNALRVDDSNWGETFQVLRKLPNLGTLLEADENTANEGGVVIPITRLRKIYSLVFRKVLNSRAFRTLLCKNTEETAGLLANWFCRACNEFARYDNQNEPFYTPQEGKRRTKQTLAYLSVPTESTRFAKLLQAKLIRGQNDNTLWEVAGGQGLNFRYVDFEISPYRTTNRAFFDDGHSARACGGGGLDLLLITEDGVPIIGEIKAKTDTDIFFALVQSLVYASELVTRNQWERLHNIYTNRFNGKRETPKCDIYLIYENSDRDPALFSETRKIAEKLLNTSGVSNYVVSGRKLPFLERSLESRQSN
jgi:hypothetical protein